MQSELATQLGVSVSSISKWTERCASLQKQFREEKRNVLLFVDNFSGHFVENEKSLTNIKLVFFPPNCTSKLQPLDQGIIFVFKGQYRATIVSRMVDSIENGTTFDISLKDPIDITVLTWSQLSRLSTRNCFKKCGFNRSDDEVKVQLDNAESTTKISELLARAAFPTDFNFHDYATCDDDLLTSAPLDDNTIVANTNEKLQSPNDVESDDEEDPEREPPPSRQKVLDGLKELYFFLQCQSVDTSESRLAVQQLQGFIESKITSKQMQT